MRSEGRARFAICLLAMVLLFGVLVPLTAMAATSITSISPTEGSVGTTVRLIGKIETFGGKYSILFDGVPVGQPGQAPSNSLLVDATFQVPEATGTDAGEDHSVALMDNAKGSISPEMSFALKTNRAVLVDKDHIREGLDSSITVTVAGGIASKLYEFDVGVTDPSAGKHTGSISFTTSDKGSGGTPVLYPSDFPVSSGANTNFVGTYNIVATEVAPGSGPSAAGNFLGTLTDAGAYERFGQIEVRSSGWKAQEKVVVDIRMGGQSVRIGGTTYPFKTTADTTGLLVYPTGTLPADAPTGTLTVTVTSQTGPTFKNPADVQAFDVTPTNKIRVMEVVQPADAVQRTETAVAGLSVEYPDGAIIDVDHLGSFAVTVFDMGSAKAADAAYDSDTQIWSASWKSPRDASLGAHSFGIAAGAVVDIYANTGPTTEVKSSPFSVNPAQLTVLITDQWSADSKISRTATPAMAFKVMYPDKSLFTSADFGSASVNVTLLAADVTDFGLGSTNYDQATGKWMAQWTIPYDAALSGGYKLLVKAGKVVDKSSNSNTEGQASNAFEVTKVTLIVPAIATDRGSYERDQQVFFSFRPTYLDGSAVTTGTAKLTLMAPDGSKAPLEAAYDPAHSAFEAHRFLNVLDPLGSYTVMLAPDGIADGAANSGPSATLSVSFQLVPAIQVIQVDVDVGSLYLAGETAQFTVLTANRGTAIDVASITASLIRPDGSQVALQSQRVDTGVYRVSFAVASGAPTGSYTLMVNARVMLQDTVGQGTAIKSFLISQSLTALGARVTQIENNIATIQTDVGTMKLDIKAINAVVIRVDGNVATIQTAVGTLTAEVGAIHGQVTDIQSGVATVKTDLGTVKTEVGAIHGQVTDIQSGVATVKTDVGTVKTDVAAIRPQITDISNGVATVKTDVGTLKTDVASIRPVVTSLQGDVATVKTDVGTVKGTVTSMQGDVATVKTDVGTIKARVPSEVAAAPTVQNAVVLLYIVAGLALVAAVGAMGAVRVIIRRLAR